MVMCHLRSPCSGKVTWFSGFAIYCLSAGPLGPYGPPGRLWAGPLWASWALMGRALMGSPGPHRPGPFALP